MRYVIARMIEDSEQEAYRIYITDGLTALTKNTFLQNDEGGYLAERYYDIMHPPKEGENNSKNIINRIKKGLRG